MRLCSLALSLSLLLCACSQTGGGGDNAAANSGETGLGAGPADASNSTIERQPANGIAPAEPSGPVTLSAASEQVAPGATMTLTLANGSSEQIGYNLCASDLQTSAGRPVPTGLVCTMELRTLEPGRDVDYRYQLPVNMVAGSYRFATQVEWMQSGRRSGVRSNSFEVR